ncbi:diguanylate cyclase domain-containing protein [Pseudomonas sp. PLB05]|uniref:diguanylate cyclase domain-containing protein n=1 Tax=Pseudomonas sp. PLB05 TaxID=2899078 RepID=UPI001E64DBF1|nr:diguanylate cyclase [Pseudomonas sp. PLB05]MCD4863148.1 diguanylate cyclase [Pseudomonas sp. PLB05]
MIRLFSFQSLRAKFAIVVALSVLVLTGIFGTVIGASSISRLKEQTGNQLAEYAASMIDRLDRDMYSRSKELTVLSALEALRQPGSVGEARRLLNHLTAQFPSFSWIGLTDTEGKVVASTGRLLEGMSIAQRPVFINGQDRTFVGDVHEAVMLAKLLPNPSGEAMKFVDISMPIRDNAGAFKGVLASHLSWQWAAEVGRTIFEPAEKSLPGLEYLVVSQDGMVLLGPKHLIGKPIDPSIDYRSGARWAVSQWQDRKLYVVGLAESAGLDGYPGLGWTVVTRQPADLAFAEAREIRSEILLWGSVLAIAFAVLGWFVAGIITRPLNRIAEAATRLSEGAKVEIPLVRGSLEVEKLSMVIRHLVESLTSLHHELEDRVQARTQQLSDTNLVLYNAIQRQKLIEQTVRDREAELTMVIENANDAYINLDDTGAVTAWNKTAEETFGWSAHEAIGVPLDQLIIPTAMREAHRRGMARFLTTGEAKVLNQRLELPALRKDGTSLLVEVRLRALKIGTRTQFSAFLHDISDRKAREAQREQEARQDPLTGLLNRRALAELLPLALARADRNKTPLALVFIDLDGFKAINDTFGHEAGDELLRVVAGRLRDTSRASDMVARLAGDEFTVALESVQNGLSDARMVASKMLASIVQPVELPCGSVHVQASMGIAVYTPGSLTSAPELIREADVFMYEAKRAGKGMIFPKLPNNVDPENFDTSAEP